MAKLNFPENLENLELDEFFSRIFLELLNKHYHCFYENFELVRSGEEEHTFFIEPGEKFLSPDNSSSFQGAVNETARSFAHTYDPLLKHFSSEINRRKKFLMNAEKEYLEKKIAFDCNNYRLGLEPTCEMKEGYQKIVQKLEEDLLELCAFSNDAKVAFFRLQKVFTMYLWCINYILLADMKLTFDNKKFIFTVNFSKCYN